MEEYITEQGFSSLDIECCDNCFNSYHYDDMSDYRGERICKKCMEEIQADIRRDEMKDERWEND